MANIGIAVPYNHDLKPLETLLAGVRRPGDFCVQGSLEAVVADMELSGANAPVERHLVADLSVT